MGTLGFEKPLTQRFEISGVGLKTFELFVDVAVFHLTQANEHKALMHIDSTTTGIENIHRYSSCSSISIQTEMEDQQRGTFFPYFLLRALKESNNGWFIQAPWYILMIKQAFAR